MPGWLRWTYNSPNKKTTTKTVSYPAKSKATPKGLDMMPTSSSLSPNWIAKFDTDWATLSTLINLVKIETSKQVHPRSDRYLPDGRTY